MNTKALAVEITLLASAAIKELGAINGNLPVARRFMRIIDLSNQIVSLAEGKEAKPDVKGGKS